MKSQRQLFIDVRTHSPGAAPGADSWRVDCVPTGNLSLDPNHEKG
jgi:hypothetical protein